MLCMNLAIWRHHIVNGINVYIHFALLALPCLFCCLCFGFPMPQWEEAQKTQHTPVYVWIPCRDDWKQEKSDESLKARQKQWILGTKFECSCEFHCMACARNFIDILPLPLHGIRKRRNSAYIGECKHFYAQLLLSSYSVLLSSFNWKWMWKLLKILKVIHAYFLIHRKHCF